jgi:ATP-binding cassette subfamily B protein
MRLWWLRLLRLVRPSPGAVGSILALTIATAVINALKPWPMKWLVDRVLVAAPSAPTAQLTRLRLAAWLAGATVAIFLLGQLVQMALAFVQNGFANRAVYKLAAKLFDHLQALSILFHSRRAAADLVRRVTTDSACARDLLVGVALPIVTSVTTVSFMLAIMWRLDGMLTLASLLVLLPMGLMIKASYEPMSRRAMEQQQVQSELMTLAERTLGTIPTVQLFNRELAGDAQFGAISRRAVGAYLATILAQLRFKLGVGAMTALGTAAVIALGGWHVLNGRLTVGSLLVFLAYLASFYAPLEALAYVSTSLSATRANAQRVLEVLSSCDQLPERADPVRLVRSPSRGLDVRFEQVSFAYELNQEVLQGVSFEVRPGQTVAIVGPTGAGKTTLLSMLPRLIDPSSGRVLLGGVDVRDLKLSELREAVAVVPQEPLLLPASVAENIAYGRPEATMQQIQAAAESAHAAEFINRLPQGYATVLGERGCTLSVGQRQRLAIARALLREAAVLVLDEPTSALDAESEALVVSALKRACAGGTRTCLIIAHRLSTVREADRIVVLSGGKVVEEGSPTELAASGGIYEQFLKLQQVA